MSNYLLAREEFAFYGREDVSLINLLRLIIGDKSEELVAKLSEFSIRKLGQISVNEFEELGLTKLNANRLCAAFALAYQYAKNSTTLSQIKSPDDAYEALKPLSLEEQEHFVCLYLNTKNEILSRKTIFIGSLNASIVHPREVMKEGLRVSAASIILSHNHPSGDPTPSKEDIEVTKRLNECGKIMGIEILDHIILGHNRYLSLKEKGYL
ncbi:DNA repair protein RadC [Bacillus sp. OAE603]|uniref:RadC family protein n=1 Tax=Gottfriedia sp. OAE603 TaxID=2663872 RepID=UPI00178A16F6